MNAADFVRDYGYYAVFAGTFFEGEMVMLAAGVAASTGILGLPAVIFVGMAGIFASDTVCFVLGRLLGGRIRRWFPRLHARLDGAFRLIERYEDKLIIYFQFFPGLCTVTPMAFGMTGISVTRFMALDLIGNALWTFVFALGGYGFGAAFEGVVHDARRWGSVLGTLLVLAGLIVWWCRRAAAKRLLRSTE